MQCKMHPSCSLSRKLLGINMSYIGKSFICITFLLLLLASIVCIYNEFWLPRCYKPFIYIGRSCYFFSTNRPPTYEYFKMTYKGHTFSVPLTLDWLHASFGCETIDAKSRLVSIDSSQEMYSLARFIQHNAYITNYPMFWSSGHRGQMLQAGDQQPTIGDFYWHEELIPMNFTNWAESEPQMKPFPEGFCVYLEFVGHQLLMGTAHCEQKMGYVCELQPN